MLKTFSCLTCGIRFNDPRGIQNRSYCSRKCCTNSTPRVEHVCPVCGVAFMRKPSVKSRCCSRACLAMYNGVPIEDRLVKYSFATGSGCIVWTGAKRVGYGTTKIGGKNVFVHRLMYERTFGKIPPGLNVCHACDNPPCINPQHLFLGSHQDNVKDRDMKKRQVKGVACHTSKLTETDVRIIRIRAAAGESCPVIAKSFSHVRIASVRAVIARTTWKQG